MADVEISGDLMKEGKKSTYQITSAEGELRNLIILRAPPQNKFSSFCKMQENALDRLEFPLSHSAIVSFLYAIFFRTINIKFCFYFTSVPFCGGPTSTTTLQDEKVKMEKSIIFRFLIFLRVLTSLLKY